jgi:hypothetical protein
MNVGDESRPLEGSVGRLGLAELAKTSAEIEDEGQLPLHLQRDACGVAPVTPVFR